MNDWPQRDAKKQKEHKAMRYLLWNTKLAGWHRSAQDGIEFITSHLDMAGRFEVKEAVAFQMEHRGTAVFPDADGEIAEKGLEWWRAVPNSTQVLSANVKRLVESFESRLGKSGCECGTCYACVEVFCDALYDFRKAHPEVAGPPES